MIGKPEWFKRRKYLGWGISPRTWQGWAYLGLAIMPFAAFQALPFWNDQTRIAVSVAWLTLFLTDITHIMIALKKDEREYKIEAISERNAAWFMMLVLIMGILYEALTSVLNQQTFQINWFIVIALAGGAAVKTISNIYLEKREL